MPNPNSSAGGNPNPPNPNDKPVAPVHANAAAIKTWLKGHGHQVGKVDTLPMTSEAEIKAAILSLHGITVEQWRMVGGS